jgi:hypothetical protein
VTYYRVSGAFCEHGDELWVPWKPGISSIAERLSTCEGRLCSTELIVGFIYTTLHVLCQYLGLTLNSKCIPFNIFNS